MRYGAAMAHFADRFDAAAATPPLIRIQRQIDGAREHLVGPGDGTALRATRSRQLPASRRAAFARERPAAVNRRHMPRPQSLLVVFDLLDSLFELLRRFVADLLRRLFELLRRIELDVIGIVRVLPVSPWLSRHGFRPSPSPHVSTTSPGPTVVSSTTMSSARTDGLTTQSDASTREAARRSVWRISILERVRRAAIMLQATAAWPTGRWVGCEPVA